MKRIQYEDLSVGADGKLTHLRDSNYRINLLLRSASMANIDSVLDKVSAIKESNQACMKDIEKCKSAEVTPNTANAPHAAPLFETLPKL